MQPILIAKVPINHTEAFTTQLYENYQEIDIRDLRQYLNHQIYQDTIPTKNYDAVHKMWCCLEIQWDIGYLEHEIDKFIDREV